MSAAPKVLVVEDDLDAQRVLHLHLRSWGYRPVAAYDAIAAISMARREEPDVIVLDLGLPAGDGHVVMGRLRALPNLAHVPIVVVSARDARVEGERTLAGGAIAYVQKPLDPDELRRILEIVLQPAADPHASSAAATSTPD